MIISNSLLAKVSANEEAQRKVEVVFACSREATPDSEGHIIDNYINYFILFQIKISQLCLISLSKTQRSSTY